MWAVFDPGNYDNIMEYSFRDDGSIGFRSGVTGFNNPERQTMAHMHNTLWRIDVDLDGWQNDVVKATTHVEVCLDRSRQCCFGGWWEEGGISLLGPLSVLIDQGGSRICEQSWQSNRL